MLYDMLVGPVAHLGRTALVGVLAYLALVLAARSSGKRTLFKLNAFDGDAEEQTSLRGVTRGAQHASSSAPLARAQEQT